MNQPAPPDALLLLSTGCPFCPTVLSALGDLIKQGYIARLEVVNIDRHPDRAAALGVRSVPWLRLGPFELDGLRSHAELKLWAERAGSPAGMVAYISELLATGALRKLIELCARDVRYLDAIPAIVKDTSTDLQVRLGVGAFFEELQGEPRLGRLVDALGQLVGADDARVRSDACHYLALTRDRRAIAYIQPLIDDVDADVREVAAESLAAFGTVRS